MESMWVFFVFFRTVAEVSSSLFWRHPFTSICNPPQLIEFTVMDMEVLPPKDLKRFKGQGTISHKVIFNFFITDFGERGNKSREIIFYFILIFQHLLADIWVVKTSELGINDNPVHTRTHLGAILKPGDSVLGYSLADANTNDTNFDKLPEDAIPDVILVKKFYGDRATRRRARNWKLRHLNEEATNFNPTSE